MAEQKDVFLKRLLATFRSEADDRLKAMTSLLLDLERSADANVSQDLVETLFREAHSLKGAARAVNVSSMESVCQSLEDALFGLKSGRLSISAELLDVWHRVLDGLRAMLVDRGTGDGLADDKRVTELKALLARAPDGHAASPSPPPSPPKRRAPRKATKANPRSTALPREPAAPHEGPVEAIERASSVQAASVRINAAQLDALLLQVEELLSLKHSLGQRVHEWQVFGRELKLWDKESKKAYREARVLERAANVTGGRNGPPARSGAYALGLAKLASSLEQHSLHVRTFDDRVALMARAIEQDHRILSGMVDHLLSNTKQLLMLPFASLLEMLPKLVRDLSRDKGREAQLTVRGAEIAIDKRILEGLKDPLIHLVRNAIDHGIEDPDVRARKGKPQCGTIAIVITHTNGGKVDVLISDDGAGIDGASIKSASVKIGAITRKNADELSEPEILSLMFRSGVSTSPIITDLSGRGLGLAIVREKVEVLGGTVSVETRVDAGTSFRLILPLTLATVRGLLTRVSGRIFVLPIAHVERVLRAQDGDIKTVENRETIQVGGQILALVWLADILEIPRGTTKEGMVPGSSIVILNLGIERMAFRIDAVLGEQEILVKNLGAPLARVRNVAGATVLGTGQVAPILNVSDVMKSALNVKTVPVSGTGLADDAVERLSVLVAEDSITARMLMKNILESAGYDVTTAVDGAEALMLLKTGHFNLVVSDVEMPRMDGFDLTAKIRATRELAALPVVLVTALESREHRERGVDVGANAYIVKSSFDQSNLLEVIARLT
ncbi:MAG: hybrid sensor histidine kinase/response regulator [Acidiferrobacter sp.]